jgi:hypothetical protein
MTPAFYNHLTHSYETSDKTTVASEICDGDSLSDAFRAAQIREQQRRVGQMSLSRGRLPTDGSETQVGESLA